ncbi:hypothetical protein [Xanthomonas theicola]|uniref:Uncharacterized protein n=1 Tax=Xanthomonas theicola TaxID=56464 RepID=A0A2S6YZA0_9XANT|nr:hypothetical protein [Xanthomonas theicola]PPT73296.1 hypothetical protein XthCFBP4691_20440 [Xanthomonas theicola]
MNAPKITINSSVETRTVTTAKGMQKAIYSQRATLETEAMRIQVEVEVDGLDKGYPVGAVKEGLNNVPDHIHSGILNARNA